MTHAMHQPGAEADVSGETPPCPSTPKPIAFQGRRGQVFFLGTGSRQGGRL